MGLLYDSIGDRYTAVRREDPRIAARIRAALGDARTVVNVGAGSGAYEPSDLEVTAVEPSEVMIAQRSEAAAPVVLAFAEELPFEDGSFDAAMAVLSDHHWADRPAGLRELRRVARRVVVFQWDPAYREAFWLARDHLPSFARGLDGFWEELLHELGAPRTVAVPIPHDCRDGFLMAYWRRPEAYLDPLVRANISVFSQLPPAEIAAMDGALRADLESGAWARRNAAILGLDELDLGYRLLVAPAVASRSSLAA